jgi:heme exporter protein A
LTEPASPSPPRGEGPRVQDRPSPSLSPGGGGLEAENLACRRGERLVFAGVSFAVPRGGALLLTGPNGSGKSSLLRVLSGLLPPEAGRLLWDGKRVADDPSAHHERLHFQSHLDAIKPALTAFETLQFWAGLRGASADAVDRSLQRVRLAHLAEWPCRFLSAGQKRRLALARLFAAPAPLWLLDEPTTGLDSEAVADLETAIAEHRAEGGLVVLSTHTPVRLEEALSLDLGAR